MVCLLSLVVDGCESAPLPWASLPAWRVVEERAGYLSGVGLPALACACGTGTVGRASPWSTQGPLGLRLRRGVGTLQGLPPRLALQPLADEASEHDLVIRDKARHMGGMAAFPALQEQILGPIPERLRIEMGAGLPEGLGELMDDEALGVVELRKAAQTLVLWIAAPVVLGTIVAACAGGMRRRLRQAALAQLLERLGAREIHDGRA